VTLEDAIVKKRSFAGHPSEGAETRCSPDLPIPVNSSRKSNARDLVGTLDP
jgi:hypothetical protein